MIKTGSTIGILGGGQLGRMMAIAARQMGYRIATLDPTPDCPCAQVADHTIVAAYNDLEAARRLYERSDVITYEFENVDAEVAAVLEDKLPQGSELLRTTQHRWREKQALWKAGLPTAHCQRLEIFDDLYDFPAPLVIKTATGGYDGKGQGILVTYNDIAAFERQHYNPKIEYVIEAYVPFECELSVIVCRNARGEVSVFPPAENEHRHHILHTSVVPARVSPSVGKEAQAMARHLAEHLQLVGTLAMEFFVVKEKLYVNELAPRPAQFGHYTLDACTTNQFEQHIRAICGLPLGEVRLHSPVAMVNLLGQHIELLDQETIGSAKLHLYGKSEAKHGRKMGHINVTAPTVNEALQIIAGWGWFGK